MKRNFPRDLAEAPLLWLTIAALAAGIFFADTVTDREIAFPVLYVTLILLCMRSGRSRTVMVVGIGCVVLTILSYVLTPQGDTESGIINCALSLLAIGATTYLAIRIEITEAAGRQTQRDLARMARIMLVGELGSSIAHEVSQPITAIVANGNAALRWLAAAPPNQEEARRAIDRVVRDADLASEVIARVRRLVARAAPAQDKIDVVETIVEALAFVRDEIHRNEIQLRTEFASNLPMVTGDRVQLQQVILNLVVNAIEAMAATDRGRRELVVSAVAAETEITVSVRDSGVGLPPASLARIFEAFHTTKPAGMGMGLAISRSIIEAHGGAVYAAPNHPRGTLFGFTLPLCLRTRG
ncbi:ATP-binding protein [Rhizobium calliandrae]|uniref:histidine kinase n=1 Tax=Rhizobium calliandrae TaxID=1312182 RepID=A0ABT7KLP0_9HYPH|nr:ATP-binding protein [Rhizobium calliandrae]MDL2409561.1 ATP-binding protein [Rhizobium calliandrae]